MEKKSLSIFAIIVFVGVAVCFHRGIDHLFNYNNEPLGIAWISLAVALMGALTGVVSYYISSESKDIAIKSDKKMKSIANANFLQIVTQIEDARINFNFHGWDKELYIWRTKCLVEMANELLKRDEEKKLIEIYNIQRLVNYFNKSIEQLLIRYKWNKLDDNQQNNTAESLYLTNKMINKFIESDKITTYKKWRCQETDDKGRIFQQVLAKKKDGRLIVIEYIIEDEVLKIIGASDVYREGDLGRELNDEENRDIVFPERL